MDRDGQLILTVLFALLLAATFAASDGLSPAVRGTLVLAALAVAAWPFYVLVAGPRIVNILSRALLAMIPIGGVAGVICYAILRWDVSGDTSSRALAAGVIVAAGWVAGFVTQELRRSDLREETRRDLTRALEVEVGFVVARGKAINWTVEQQKAKTRFAQDPGYVPFVHLKLQRHALSKIMEQMELLKRNQIEAVSAYAHLVDEIGQMTEKLNEDDFKALDAQRREEVFLFWLGLQANLADEGQKVLDVLATREAGR